MRKLGTPAPDFRLPEPAAPAPGHPRGRLVSLSDFAASPALLVMFICNHCPFVRHIRADLARLGEEYQKKGVAIVAISSNDAAKYPDDAPATFAAELHPGRPDGYTFPYLYDENQAVAKAYGAACTPDFFLFDRARRLVYRGQFDDSRPSNALPVTGRDLRAALDAVLAGRPVSADQKPSIGCNIKWKPGNEPAYAMTGAASG
jgi:thiol-disulfide isomerase/thioredoxin